MFKKSLAATLCAALTLTGPVGAYAQPGQRAAVHPTAGPRYVAPVQLSPNTTIAPAPGLNVRVDARAKEAAFVDLAASLSVTPGTAEATRLTQALAQNPQLQVITSRDEKTGDGERAGAISVAYDKASAKTGSDAAVVAAPQQGMTRSFLARNATALKAAALAVPGTLVATQALAQSSRYAAEPGIMETAAQILSMGGPYVSVALALVGAIIAARGLWFTVPQGYVFVTNLLGRHRNNKAPGLRSKIPFLQTIRQRISIQTQTEDLDFQAITSDQANVNLKATMTYSVAAHDDETINRAAYTFVNQAAFLAALKSNVEGAIRSFIAEKKQADVAGLRSEIYTEVNKHLKETLASWGYKIENIQVKDIIFDPAIKKSMDEVVESKNELRIARTNAAANLQRVTREAEAEGEALVTTAKAEAAASIEEGKGVAQFRDEATQGLKSSVATGLPQDFIAYMSHLDMLRAMAKDGKGNALLMNGSPAGMQRTMETIREMLKKKGDGADKAKDKAGSSVSTNNKSGITGLWLLGAAAALMAVSTMGLGALPYVGASLFAVMLLNSMLFIVPEGYVYAITQFDRHHKIVGPGLNFKIPFIQQIRRRVSVQNHTEQYKKFQAITSDQANVYFNATLIYRVKDKNEQTIKNVAYKFISEETFESNLQSAVENSIRSFVNTKKQAEILGLRKEIVSQVKGHLDEEMGTWGYDLVDLQINDITFDDAMTKTMSGVVIAENERLAMENRAEAEYVAKTQAAIAFAKGIEIRAQAKREAARQRGIGVRGFREEAAKGLQKAIDESQLSPEFVSLIMTQEAMRDIAADGKGNVIDMQEPGSEGDPQVKRMLGLDLGRRAADGDKPEGKK